jgi:hypothetical protein
MDGVLRWTTNRTVSCALRRLLTKCMVLFQKVLASIELEIYGDSMLPFNGKLYEYCGRGKGHARGSQTLLTNSLRRVRRLLLSSLNL